ncbi:MAG: hypothetical protein ACMUIG_04175 [Thermoplasmatota archaeon]
MMRRTGELYLGIVVVSIMISAVNWVVSSDSGETAAGFDVEIRYVSPHGSTHTSIGSAIENSSSGDIIVVGDGLYRDPIDIDVDWVTIIGNSSSLCQIEINGDYSTGIDVRSSDVTLEKISINISGNRSNGIRIGGGGFEMKNCCLIGTGHNLSLVRKEMEIGDIVISGCLFNISGNESHCLDLNGRGNDVVVSYSSFYNEGRSSSCINSLDQEDLTIIRCSIKTNITVIGGFGHHDQSRYDMNYGIRIDGGRDIVIDSSDFYYSTGSIASDRFLSLPMKTEVYHSGMKKILNLSVTGCTLGYMRDHSRFDIDSVSGLNVSNCRGTRPSLCIMDVGDSTSGRITQIEDMIISISACSNIEVWNCSSYSLSIAGQGLDIHDNEIFIQDTGYTSSSNMAYVSGNNIEFRDNVITGVNSALYIDGEDIIARGNSISTKSYVNLVSGIGVEGNSENITIQDNNISIVTNWIGSGSAGISCYGSRNVNITRNVITIDSHMVPIQDQQTSMGIWSDGIEKCIISNNEISVSGKRGSGLFFGPLTWIERGRSSGNTISRNTITVEGDFSSCIRLYNGSDSNHFLNNSVLIEAGYNASFVHASREVEELLTFRSTSRMHSSGPDVILDRMNLNIYFPEKSNAGPKISTVSLPVKKTSIDSSCRLRVFQRLSSRSVDYRGFEVLNADHRILSREKNYSSPYYGGGFLPDKNGSFGPFVVWDREFSGSDEPDIYNTSISVRVEMKTTWNETRSLQVNKDTEEIFHVPDLNNPDIPEGFKADPVDRSQDIRLSWNPVIEHCTGYLLQVMDNLTWIKLAEVGSGYSDFYHGGLPQDTLMSYRIASINGNIHSAFSSPVQVTTGDITPPSSPSGLRIVRSYHDGFKIEWNESRDTDLVSTVCEAVEPDSEMTESITPIGPDQRTYRFAGLKPSTLYEIRITMIDDAGLSNSSVIEGRTTSGNGILRLHVNYSSIGPLSGGASDVNIYMIDTGAEHWAGITDNEGHLLIENITIPSLVTLKLVPGKNAGIVGKRDGYLTMITDPLSFDHPDMRIQMDITLEYYDFDPLGTSGSITGTVYFEPLGLSSIPAPDCSVILTTAEGSEIKTSATNASGGFRISGIPLYLELRLAVSPPPGYQIDYRGIRTDWFNLTAVQREREFTLFLEPIGDITYSYVVGIEPGESPINAGETVYIRFSHTLSVVSPDPFMMCDPAIDPQMIGICDDGIAIAVKTEGLDYSTVYRITISKDLPFEDNLTMREDFYLDFWIIEPENNDNPLNYILIPLIMVPIIVIISISAVVFLYTKSDLPEE